MIGIIYHSLLVYYYLMDSLFITLFINFFTFANGLVIGVCEYYINFFIIFYTFYFAISFFIYIFDLFFETMEVWRKRITR